VDPIYIAVGEPSTIYASPDAKSWTPEDIGANTLGDVAYGAGSFVITAYGGRIFTSPTATAGTWMAQTPLATTGLSTVVYNQGSSLLLEQVEPYLRQPMALLGSNAPLWARYCGMSNTSMAHSWP
jgi:hypothetical protein